MVSVQSSLDARNALGQSSSEAKPPLLTLGKFDVEKLLHLRFAPRAESAQPAQRTARSTSVTVRLGFQKHFHPNLQESFFVGEHPIAISLNYDYVETFFCYQMAHHRLILMGTTKISFVSRGSHAEQTTPIQFILGTVKDGLLAGTWCEYSQRLILVGNAHMYFYDPQEQKRARRIRCEPVQRGVAFKRRFLGCSPAGSLFYGKHLLLETDFILIVTTIVAYKSSPTTYNLDKYDHPPFAWLREDEPDQGTSSAMLNCKSPVTIAGRIAAMTVTYNQVALVYRTFESVKKFSHSVAIFDHNLDQGSVSRQFSRLMSNGSLPSPGSVLTINTCSVILEVNNCCSLNPRRALSRDDFVSAQSTPAVSAMGDLPYGYRNSIQVHRLAKFISSQRPMCKNPHEFRNHGRCCLREAFCVCVIFSFFLSFYQITFSKSKIFP